jgi:hypothetical protein
MLAKNQNLTLRENISKLARSFKTIKPRHAYVHNDQVWFQFASFVQSILTIDGFTADLPACLFG